MCIALSQLHLPECTYGSDIILSPAPLCPSVVQNFMQVYSDSPETSLCPAFHGTNAVNYESIFQHGLLIPGEGNSVRVANGSAHGLSIYAAKLHALYLARTFTNTNSVLVYGVVDDAEPLSCPHSIGYHTVTTDSAAVKHVGSAVLAFDQRDVIPLFVALPTRAQKRWRFARQFLQQDMPELKRWYEARRTSLSSRMARRLRRAWRCLKGPTLERALLGKWRNASSFRARLNEIRRLQTRMGLTAIGTVAGEGVRRLSTHASGAWEGRACRCKFVRRFA